MNATLGDHTAALSDVVHDLPLIVVAEGPEPHLRKQVISSMIKAIKKKHPNIEEIALHGGGGNESGAELGNVLEELSSSSLFSSEKIIIVWNAENMLFPTSRSDGESVPVSKQKNTPQDRFAEYLKSPEQGMWLLLDCEKLQKNRVLGKALVANAECVPCPALARPGDVSAWLVQRTKAFKKQLDPGVTDILFTAHGGQLGALDSEIQKLAIYVGDNQAITVDDAQAFLSGSTEFDVFGLTNSVEERNLPSALEFARKICRQGTRDASGKRSDGESSAHRALAMLANTMESILHARIAMGQGGSAQEVASAVGTSPWRAERLIRSASKFSVSDLRRILSALANEIHSTHATGGDISLSLERSVLACCGAI
ncbi:MAG: DNA polymerase III subunit delta [Planctomycetes bacterium]|nr:DNA polymerase III subunit delta [Planctomycetota bacterium]